MQTFMSGKSVLIAGAGNSGIDIGNYLSKIAIKPSWIAVRSGPTIAPQYIWGLPTHPLLVWSKRRIFLAKTFYLP